MNIKELNSLSEEQILEIPCSYCKAEPGVKCYGRDHFIRWFDAYELNKLTSPN